MPLVRPRRARAAVLACLLFAAAAPPAGAQTFERFGVRDGLPSELIHDLAIGPDGALWVATDDGLARYDGHGFRVWRARADAPGSLPTSLTSAVLPVEDGVWVGTSRGLAYLDLRTGQARVVDALPPRSVAQLVRDAKGRIWVGFGADGIWRHSPREGTTLRARLTDPEPRRTVTLATAGDDVWVEMASGPDGAPGIVCRVDPDRAACVEKRLVGWRLIEDAGRAVLARIDQPDGAGWLDWLATGDRWPVPDGALDASFGSLLRLGAGEAWMRTSAALVRVRADEAEMITPAPTRRGGLGGYDARALARDRQGNVWVGTEAGLYLARLPSEPFQAVTADPDDPATLSDDRVNGMAQDGQTLWITTNGGLNRLDLTTGRATRFDVTVPGASAALMPTARAFWQVLPLGDRLWLGAKRGGVVELRNGRARRLPMPGSADSEGIRSLVQAPDGTVWAGGRAGLWRARAGGDFVRADLPIEAVTVNVVYPARDGSLWVGTDNGVFRRRVGTWAPVAPDALCSPVVWSMAETPEDPGALWIASVDGGLGRLDLATDRVECLTARDGLPTNSVYGVVPDGRGALWATTTSGLARVDLATRRVSTFTSADGLAGDAFNLMAQLRLRDGRIAVGGPNGLTLIDPAVRVARRAPETVISGVERQGRRLPGLPAAGDTVRLAHDQGAFGVRFAVMDFRAPRRHRYRYRLVGLDDDWQRTDGAAPRAAFAGVPPGTYRFEVLGAAADTPFSDAPAVLTIEVIPAWWQRRTVWALGAFLLIGGVGAGWQGRRRRREQAAAAAARDAAEVRRRLAVARERERASLARDLHDGPVQTLYRVGHDLDALDGAARPARARVDAVARELRGMMTELRPTLVEHLGLGAALRTLGRRAEDRFEGLTVEVRDPARLAPPSPTGLAVFRIVQEALQNAGRHAAPAHVVVELVPDGDALRLTVRDDGPGFVMEDAVTLARGQHFGLLGARERAEAVGGTLVVNAAPGVGTALTARLPLGHPDPDA